MCRVTFPSLSQSLRSMQEMDTHTMTSHWSTDTTFQLPLFYSHSRTLAWTTFLRTLQILLVKVLWVYWHSKATIHTATTLTFSGPTVPTHFHLNRRSTRSKYRDGAHGIFNNIHQKSLEMGCILTLMIISRGLHSTHACLHARKTTSQKTAARESTTLRALAVRATIPKPSKPFVPMPTAMVRPASLPT